MRRIQQWHWGQRKGGHTFSLLMPHWHTWRGPSQPIRHFPPNHLPLSLTISGLKLRGRKHCSHYSWLMLGTSTGGLWFFLSRTEGNWRIFHCAGQTRNQELGISFTCSRTTHRPCLEKQSISFLPLTFVIPPFGIIGTALFLTFINSYLFLDNKRLKVSNHS